MVTTKKIIYVPRLIEGRRHFMRYNFPLKTPSKGACPFIEKLSRRQHYTRGINFYL